MHIVNLARADEHVPLHASAEHLHSNLGLSQYPVRLRLQWIRMVIKAKFLCVERRKLYNVQFSVSPSPPFSFAHLKKVFAFVIVVDNHCIYQSVLLMQVNNNRWVT